MGELFFFVGFFEAAFFGAALAGAAFLGLGAGTTFGLGAVAAWAAAFFARALRRASAAASFFSNARFAASFSFCWQALADHVETVRRNAEQKKGDFPCLTGLGQVVGSLEGVRGRIGEVDRDGVRLFLLRELEEARPSRLGKDDMGPAAGKLLHAAVALGGFEVEVKHTHEQRGL